MNAVGLRFTGAGGDCRRLDDHTAVLWSVGGDTQGGEGRTKDWNQSWGDMCAEGCADGEGARKGHPVAYLLLCQLGHCL